MFSGIITFFPSAGFLSLQSDMCEHECLPGLCELGGLFSLQHLNVSLLSLSHKNLLSLQVCCSPSGFTTTILLFRAEHVKTTNIQDCSALKKDGHICEIYKGTSSTFYRVARGV